MVTSSPLIQDSPSFESGTDGSNKNADIIPPGTAVFADINDDDGLEDKEEMWLPSKASLENKWPFEEDFESTVLDKLCIGPELSLEQRVQLLNVCRKYPEFFPSVDEKLGRCTVGFHHIPTADADPIYEPPRRFSPFQLNEINR
jgi:hypothetical protein